MNNHIVFDSRMMFKMNRTWQDAATQAMSQRHSGLPYGIPPIKQSAHGDVTNFKDFVTLLKGNLAEFIYLKNLSHYLWEDDDMVKLVYGTANASFPKESEMLVDCMRSEMAKAVHVNLFREALPGWYDLLNELKTKQIPYGVLMNADDMIVEKLKGFSGTISYSGQSKSIHPSKSRFTSYGSGSWLATLGNPVQHHYFDTTDSHVQMANQEENWRGYLIPGINPAQEIRDILVNEIYLDRIPVYSAYNDV